MILYFSATGNSAYTAQRIGEWIHDEAVDLFEKIRDRDFAPLHSKSPWVVVLPTYAWRIPRLVQKWLERTELSVNREIYFVMTCAGSIGNAGKYLKKLCAAKNMAYRGCAPVIMPENYIAMFSAPAKGEAIQIIDRADKAIEEIALLIQDKKALPEPSVTWMDRQNSGIVNCLFYPMFVHAKKFYATDACISCGKCVRVCPLQNIRLERGRPVWGKACTHCMACINRCPKVAIEYGKHTRFIPRYTCPKSAK